MSANTFDESGSQFISCGTVSELPVAALAKSENLAVLEKPQRSESRDDLLKIPQKVVRTIVNTAVCASPQLMKHTPRGLRAGTIQTLNLPVLDDK